MNAKSVRTTGTEGLKNWQNLLDELCVAEDSVGSVKGRQGGGVSLWDILLRQKLPAQKQMCGVRYFFCILGKKRVPDKV